jgi:hypothetical protein
MPPDGPPHRFWVGAPVPPGAAAVTLGSWVLVRRGCEADELLVRHELVHVEQYRALGVAGFLGRYLRAYVRWRLRGYGHWAAYRRIPFEIEADWWARRSFVAGAEPVAPGNAADGRGQGR